MQDNTVGNNNTAVGNDALRGNRTGNKNTAVGFEADVGSGALENATAIGAGASVALSNTIRLGNTSVVAVRTSGTFYSNGVSISSDARLKDDIAPVEEGIPLIRDLNPVMYRRKGSADGKVEMGLLAQEVRVALREHGLDDSAIVEQATSEGYLSLRYNDLLAPMIKAIQELDDASEAKDEQIASLEQKLESQQKALQSQQEELLAIVQSQQEQIAQLQRMMGEQFAAR